MRLGFLAATFLVAPMMSTASPAQTSGGRTAQQWMEVAKHALDAGDNANADNALRHACFLGHALGCHAEGLQMRDRAEKTNDRMFIGMASNSLTQACKLGRGEACFAAGELLLDRKWYPKGKDQFAINLAERGCLLRHARSCMLGGVIWWNRYRQSRRSGDAEQAYAFYARAFRIDPSTENAKSYMDEAKRAMGR